MPHQKTAHDAHDQASTGHGPTGHHGSSGHGSSGLTLLVIEDDPAGSLSIPEMPDATGKPIRVRTARNLTEAERLLTHDVNCILLDLTLPGTKADKPGADELETLRHVLRLAPRHAVLALTASGDAERGAEA
ncbi:phosphatase, partial [Streptomyces sp. SID14478]|nr:phosphatase [Streptomyces sp. SID14478]